MTKKELIEKAAALGIEVPKRATKAEVAALIEAAQAASKRSGPRYLGVTLLDACEAVAQAAVPAARAALRREAPERPTDRRRVLGEVVREVLAEQCGSGGIADVLEGFTNNGRPERAEHFIRIIRRTVDRKVA